MKDGQQREEITEVSQVSQLFQATFLHKEISNTTLWSYPVLHWAKAEVLKSPCDVFGKPWAKHVLVRSKLMSGLPDDGIHHIQARYLVLRLALRRAEGGNRSQVSENTQIQCEEMLCDTWI